MSKQAIREVEFITEGEHVKTVTDAETARAIGMYKDVYNKIESFDITSTTLPAKRAGFIREAFQAKSHRLKILCFKEYLPNMPEDLDGAQYECGILNMKSNKVELVTSAAIERHYGGVAMLYFNLFRGRTK